MSTSWRCWYVLAWYSRSVLSSRIVNHTPSPRHTIWRTWLSALVWASNVFYQTSVDIKRNMYTPSQAKRPTRHRWSPFPDTSLHCKTTDMGLVHCTECPFSYTPPFTGTHCTYPRKNERLSWPRWLVVHWDGLSACKQSPIQVLTGPGVE